MAAEKERRPTCAEVNTPAGRQLQLQEAQQQMITNRQMFQQLNGENVRIQSAGTLTGTLMVLLVFM